MSRTLKPFSVVALAFISVSLGGAAMADDAANEEVVTATARPKPPTSTPLTTQQQIDAWHTQPPAADISGDGTAKRKIQSEAGVSVGTGGYSSFYLASKIPFGETGTLGIAVSQTDFGKNVVPYSSYNGGYYGGPYGRSGPLWGQGGKSQSVAVSIDMNGADKGSETCAVGFRDGDRIVEPLWVTQARGVRSCDSLINPR